MKKHHPEVDPIFLPDLPLGFTNQTGKHYSSSVEPVSRHPYQIKKILLCNVLGSVGNVASGYNNKGCHIAVMPNGKTVYVNNLLHTVWNGGKFASESVIIMIDGNFEPVRNEGDEDNRRGTVKVLTEDHCLGARNAIDWAIQELEVLGCIPSMVVANRQAGKQRGADPGSEIWRGVALWARDNLGLEAPCYLTVDTGLPIPRQWDTRSMFGWDGSIDEVGIAIVQAVCNHLFGMNWRLTGVGDNKMRVGVLMLNEHLGFGQAKGNLDLETIESLVELPEYDKVVTWIEKTVTESNLPFKSFDGETLVDIFETYPG